MYRQMRGKIRGSAKKGRGEVTEQRCSKCGRQWGLWVFMRGLDLLVDRAPRTKHVDNEDITLLLS
jgi:hypothetical protein